MDDMVAEYEADALWDADIVVVFVFDVGGLLGWLKEMCFGT
jgi:hypothetical protein